MHKRAGLLFTMLLLAVGAHAAIVHGLYEASVPVPDQSPAAREVALQQALAAVLVKVTGERTAGGVPALAKLIKDPNQFLQQYRYEQTQDSNGAAPASGVTYFDLTRNGALAIAGTGLVLHAKFDPEAVDQAARAAGEPLWGRERPSTLVWLALQDGPAETVLSSVNGANEIQAMNAVAMQRGMPLQFPLMDAADLRAIAFADLWTGNLGVIQQASSRYHPDAILIGNISHISSGQYAVRWELLLDGTARTWNGTPGDLATAVGDGVQTLADDYAHHYAIAATAQGVNGVPVIVDGITNVDAYARVLNYLSTLTPVKSVEVAQVTGSRVRFSLNTRGSVDNLAQAIALGELLRPFAAATPAPSATTSAPPVPAAITPGTLHFQYGN